MPTNLLPRFSFGLTSQRDRRAWLALALTGGLVSFLAVALDSLFSRTGTNPLDGDGGLQLIAGLVEQIANLAAGPAGQQPLSQSISDLTNLMVNLGSPDLESQTGLVGKLTGITGQVGQTGVVLDQVNGAVLSHGNARSNELRNLDLRAAQFAEAQVLLGQFAPFALDGDQAETTTIFIYHLRGKA
ncbi:MAG: hypothetical protein FWG16_08555 [Micrococcales bacterium]|nr:hypothetical protein [Micrococcales bacterium]